MILYKKILLLLLLIPFRCFASILPTDRFYINDYANIIDSEVEDYIFENSVKLNNETSAQIVVVTIDSLEGNSIEEYATELFRNFGIGDKDKNNGVLFLVALDERKSRIEVGYGLEDLLTDGKTGRIQDEYMIPYFKNNSFSEGILNGYKAVFEILANKYKYTGEVLKAKSLDDGVELSDITIILLAYKFIITMIFIAIDFVTTKRKVFVLIILEAITIYIDYKLFTETGLVAALSFGFIGTILNYTAAFVDANDASYGSSYSSSSGGHYHSSSHHSHHGGGGRSGGGGSSRSF